MSKPNDALYKLVDAHTRLQEAYEDLKRECLMLWEMLEVEMKGGENDGERKSIEYC